MFPPGRLRWAKQGVVMVRNNTGWAETTVAATDVYREYYRQRGLGKAGRQTRTLAAGVTVAALAAVRVGRAAGADTVGTLGAGGAEVLAGAASAAGCIHAVGKGRRPGRISIQRGCRR